MEEVLEKSYLSMCLVFNGDKKGGKDTCVSILLEKEHKPNHWPVCYTCEGRWAAISSCSSVCPGPAVASCPLPESCREVWCDVALHTHDGLSYCARPVAVQMGELPALWEKQSLHQQGSPSP